VTIDQILAGLYVFSLAAFLGYQIISKVPQLLHTPLMAFTNAISGISLVASLLKQKNIPVVFGPVQDLPTRPDFHQADRYRAAAALLNPAGTQ